jgi:WD40 repeat protein
MAMNDPSPKALNLIVKIWAGFFLLQAGFNFFTEFDTVFLPKVLVGVGLNFALWRQRSERYYLLLAALIYQFLHNFYWWVTPSFLLPIIAYSNESKLLWGVAALFYFVLLVFCLMKRHKLGYAKPVSLRNLGILLIALSVLASSASWSADLLPWNGYETVQFEGLSLMNGTISPDGRYLVLNFWTQKFESLTVLWNTQAKTTIRTLFSGETTHRIKFSPDGKFIANFGPGAKVWDVGSGKMILEVKDDRSKQHMISTGSFVANGRQIAYGTQTGIRLVSLDSGEAAEVFIPDTPDNKKPRSTAFSVCASPDGTRIAVAREQEVAIWDITTKQPVWVKKSKLEFIGRRSIVAFSANGKYLALTGLTESKQYGVELWDVHQQKSLETFDFGAQVLALAFSPDGEKLAVGGAKSRIELISTTALKKENLRGSPTFGVITLIVFSPDGKRMYGGGFGKLGIWDMAQ